MSFYYLVAPTTVVRATEPAFTYSSDTELALGTLVRVSVGKKVLNGVVIRAVAQKPSFATKPIEAVLAPDPLPVPLLKLADWLSAYYATHLATVLQTILPSGMHKTRRDAKHASSHPIRNRAHIVLNGEQQAALDAIKTGPAGTVLLHGVTGSGKTAVYIEAAKYQAESGKSTIVLVPEIALTPQLVAEFANHFNNLVVTHSGLTEAQRHQAWQKALAQPPTEPLVVIGPRSALFMPVANLGLIVVDEAHEPSYKQEQAPRYSALRAATVLAGYHKMARVVLGSATPSVTDYYLAQKTGSHVLRLAQPAVKSAPVVADVIDLKRKDLFRKHRFFSDALLAGVQESLDAGHQTLLFHNRRGTAPTTMCEHCGWLAECPTCFLPLTLHADSHILRCHLCNYQLPVPPSCPSCGEPTILFKGIGTKLIEAEITKLFPKARIARFDADTHQSQAVHNRYQELYDGHIDILIGTQMLAKGLDLPNLRLVGVVQADSGLILPDFQSEERVFQLLYQVMGRVGRGTLPGRVVIQTFQPDHPIVKAAVARDYSAFYQAEIKKRENGHFPPFRFLLKLSCSYKTEAGAVNASMKMAKLLRSEHPQVEVLGPTPSFYERMGGAYRWQLVVKSTRRSDLIAIAASVPAGWQADLDPSSLL
ncbi:MAG TPA: primosomal protein N' [Candidatus Saccharimonadales bacterium]|nr:primosomal protein N' [Candidatus Saccharimonadales bacterium]